jgi:hypothetical protein
MMTRSKVKLPLMGAAVAAALKPATTNAAKINDRSFLNIV